MFFMCAVRGFVSAARRLYGAEKRAEARNVKRRRKQLSVLERKISGEVFSFRAGRVIWRMVRFRRRLGIWDIFLPFRREEEDHLGDFSMRKSAEGRRGTFGANVGNKNGERER